MINAEALLRLADKLEGVGDYKKPVPQKMFDLGLWYNKGDCGTTACACGWATSDKWFRERGFKRLADDMYFDGLLNWDAVQKFFGMTEGQAWRLFSNSGYTRADEDPNTYKVTQFAVAKHIRKFVAENAPHATTAADKMEDAIFSDLWAAIPAECF